LKKAHISNIALMALAREASYGVRHVELGTTIMLSQYVAQADREKAVRCYRALIGERALPESVGRYHV